MARQKLTAYLIKPRYRKLEFSKLIKDDDYTSYSLKDGLNIEGKIIVGDERENIPDWIAFLRLGTNQTIPNMSNKSTRAVLFIEHDNNLLAFTHGHGRHMLKDYIYERDFGMRIVLNTIKPNDFRSIDAATIDISSIQKRSQSSKSYHITNLNFDVVSDLLRAVTGTPENDRFGKVISGKDTFHFSYEFNNGFRDFKEICRFLIEAYQSEIYKENFGWVDNLQIIDDREIKEKLDELLIEEINNKNTEDISIGIPEITDYFLNESYSYTEKGEKFEDLLIEDYYSYLEKFGRVSLSQIERHTIFSHSEDGDTYNEKWKLYDCLVFELEDNSTTYILTLGEWFKVNDDYAAHVTDYVERIESSEIEFLPCKKEESEQEYNQRISSIIADTINLDRKIISYESSRIELCDLMRNGNELIHVKKWYGSSTLSHLYSKGRISGEILLRDEDFRQKSIDKI